MLQDINYSGANDVSRTPGAKQGLAFPMRRDLKVSALFFSFLFFFNLKMRRSQISLALVSFVITRYNLRIFKVAAAVQRNLVPYPNKWSRGELESLEVLIICLSKAPPYD